YTWPGNVRELEHVISRAALKTLSRGASRDHILTLEREVLDVDAEQPIHEPESTATDNTSPALSGAVLEQNVTPLRIATENSERHAIQQALAQANNNWAQAARLLDIDSSNLHKLAKKLRLK